MNIQLLVVHNIYIYIMAIPQAEKHWSATITIILLSILLVTDSNAQPSCQALCNCNSTNSQCQQCFNSFDAYSTISNAINATCPCPVGFYSLNNTCMFCKQNCKVCVDGNSCTECLTGYTTLNNTCVVSKYFMESTWLDYSYDADFKYSSAGVPSLFGFVISPSNSSTVINSNVVCPIISSNKIVTVSSTQNLNIVRRYLGLPFHQWVHVTIRYAAIDAWAGQQIQFQLYLDQQIVNKTYNNSYRNQNLCGGANADSIDQVHTFLSHTSSSLGVSLSLPANITLLLHSIKLDIGTCPRNCLTCSAPNICLTCKPYYNNINGTCTCNTTLAHTVSYGCLQNCQPGYVFVAGLERCVLCSMYMANCYACVNVTYCTACNRNTFYYNGVCAQRCPPKTFPKRNTINGTLVEYCSACSQNCTICFNQTICIICDSGSYLSQGSCVSVCPNDTVLSGGRCMSAVPGCLSGCLTCNSSSVCNECQIGFWFTSGYCAIQCPLSTYESSSKTCLPCSSNCLQCIDPLTCQTCLQSYTLRNGTCQDYSSTCTTVNFYFDLRVRNCIACPTGCLTCYRTLCYTCNNGFYLDNGLCLSVCSAQKYQVSDNITSNNICWWKSQLCETYSNTTQDTCNICKSQLYPSSLNPDSQCRSTCPSTKTSSQLNTNNIIDTSRVCNLSCISNCETCIQQNICLKCITGYVLSGVNVNNCVAVCESGFVSDSVQCLQCPYLCTNCDMNGNCLVWTQNPSNISCNTGCSLCINTTCVACAANYYLNSSGLCATSCPTSTFGDTLSRQCRKCSPQCSECLTFSRCSKCTTGFYLNGETCVRECPVGRYPNEQLSSCDACASNCRTCSGPYSYQCLTCYLGSSKDHAECVPTCPVHKYTDSYGSCDWCHEICRYCFGPAQFQCLECNSGNYLYRSECYLGQCPAATYLAIPATRQCKDCSWGCAVCTSPSQCSQCFGGFYLNNGYCLDVCPVSTYYSWTSMSCIQCPINCISCISNSTCSQCSSNYSLYNGGCMFGCPNATFSINYYYGLQCQACPQTCTNCTSWYQCTSCISGLVLRNGQCRKQCDIGKYYDIGTNSCRPCSAGCVSCTTWGCNDCQIGYNIYNGACIQNCPTSTYLTPSTVPPSCSLCPLTCLSCISFFQCSQCKPNYSLVNGVCTNNQNSCVTGCQICADSSNCILCQPGYLKIVNSTGSYCVSACTVGFYPVAGIQCRSCSPQCVACSNEQTCTLCQTGLILFNGRCISDCYIGFYSIVINSTKICQPCSTPCQQCSQSATNCTVCLSPTATVINSTCVQNRQCNLQSTFYSQALGYCLPCVMNCQICHNPWECDQCLPNYFRTQDKLCRGACGAGTYQQISLINSNITECIPCPYPCLNCASSSQCSQCLPGFPLNTTSSRCQQNCNLQPGAFINVDTNTCDRCSQSCLTCVISASSCTSCAQGFYLVANQCIRNCPDGTFPAANIRSCLPCGQFCQSCTSQENCQNCQPNTVTYNQRCFIACPDGYYNLNGVCMPCISPCRSCTGGSTYECTNCLQGYFYYGNRCTQNCPDGYYKSIQSSSCKVCPIGCLTCQSYTQCQTCQPGYTFNTTSQQCQSVPSCPTTSPTCRTCFTNTTTFSVQCSSCFVPYYLENEQCVQQCSNGFYQSLLTGQCQPCPSNCVTCSGPNSCTNCTSTNYIFNGICYTHCPTGMHPYTYQQNDVTVNSCTVDPCIYYAQNSTCSICVSPFLLYNGQCVGECPAGTFRSELSCRSCPTGCSQCADLAHCTACVSPYHFYNMRCVSECPSGTYSYIVPLGTTNPPYMDRECVQCPTKCLSCSNSTICTACIIGYYLTSTSQCQSICPLGYYPNPSISPRSCSLCPNNCLTCTSLSSCTQCNTTVSYLNVGQCVTDCPDGTYTSAGVCAPCQQYCRICGINSTCTICQNGYYLNRVTNQCVRQCPAGTYITALRQCSPCSSSCATCVSANQCQTCSNSSVLHLGQCVTVCPSGYILSLGICRQCDPMCRECSVTVDNCTSCPPSYNLVNGYCRNTCPSHTFMNASNQCQSCTSAGNTRCSECVGLAVDQCVQCYSPYFIIRGQCVSSCPVGYYGYVGTTQQCLPCDASCVTCASLSTTCTSCPWGYFLVNGRCLPSCPTGTYASNDSACQPCTAPCSQCVSSTQCSSCLTGYYLTPFQTCVTNCSSLQNTGSQIFAYWLNPSTSACQPCSPSCISCTSSSTCTQCVSPYHLYLSSCIFDCPVSTYYTANNNTCTPCSKTNCQICTSSTQCTVCIPGTAYLFNGDCLTNCPSGYTVLNGICVINCPSGYTLLNGICVINQNNNTTCLNGYLINFNNGSSQCMQYCPYGYYAVVNITTKSCLPCSIACLSCTGSSSCQICDQPYKLFNGQCISVCPQSYVELNQTCVPCASNCATCSPINTECTSCLSPNYLISGQCVSICPDGYYADTVTKSCLKCAVRCSKCSSATSCTQCKNSRYSLPTCSDNTCPANQYKLISTGQCANCDSSCATCTGGSPYNCVTCNSPSVMIAGQCRTLCPNGTVLITNNNTCVYCSTGCKNCSYIALNDTTQCMQCFDPMILNAGICIQDCSVLETSVQAYTSDGSQCYPCSVHCLSCIVTDASTGSTGCTVCSSGYILFMSNCISQCPVNYYPLQSQCYRCPQNCQTCTSLPSSCSSCTNSTFLLNGNCVIQCPNGTFQSTSTVACVPCTDPQCLICTNSANVCNSCNLPFMANSVSKKCDSCVTGYLWDTSSNMCSICSPPCLTCSALVNNCTSCINSKLLLSGNCIDRCPIGYYQPSPQVTPRQCQPCPSNCISCMPASPTQCTACIPNYYHSIATHRCLPQCPINTFIINQVDCQTCPINCTTCTSATNCSSCLAGYVLYNGICGGACPSQYVNVNGTCQQCSIGCRQCTTPTSCQVCRSDYVLNTNTGSCDQIQGCSSGQYPDINGICQPCASSCLQCTTLQNCTQCASPLFLSNGQCSSSCLPTQYSITKTITNNPLVISKICIDCTAPCDRCMSNVSCSHCLSGFYLSVNNSCVADCGYGYYQRDIITNNITNATDRNCTPCTDPNCKSCTAYGCTQCNTLYYIYGIIQSNNTNGTCVSDCPSGYYKDNTITPLTCRQCTINRCDRCNATQCLRCVTPYILLISGNVSSCVGVCPNNMIAVTTNNVSKCQNCVNNCLRCNSQQWCTKCDIGYYLLVLQTIAVNSTYNTYITTCVQTCPITYYTYTDIMTTNNSTCNPCELHCNYCSNSTNCTVCQTPSYVLVSGDCVPEKCINCTTCVNQQCTLCDTGFYLYPPQGRCYRICPDGYYGDNATKQCAVCMDHCLQCPSLIKCDLCSDGYNFTGTICIDQAFMTYGSLSNMSGFTSNITKITSAVYLGTSIGPMVFGEMATTYFNIEFCQFILFHAKATGGNPEMQNFLDSLQSISLTIPSGNQNTNSTRRLLASSLSDPLAFLATSAPIFALMGGFLAAYLCILLFEKFAEDKCLSCPRFKFYITEICIYMKKRFKWIYFDFVAWISFLPFTYFALMQLKSFSFSTGLQGFSSILSIIIIIAYPLYPFFIIYLLKQNYNDLVQQNNTLVQMSLSPYVYKVKRPNTQISVDEPWKNYITAANFRLIYDPLKYIRKFVFVLVVVVCNTPTTSIIVLIILNLVFIGYMAGFRPRVMPYMVFDFIIQGVLLAFQIFMLVYLYNDSTKVSAMSIASQAVGFITANLSLIIAIILNLIAYYKIFMCIFDLYKHLKQKMEEKQNCKLKQKQDENERPEQIDDRPGTFDKDLPQKDDLGLTKSLKQRNSRRIRNEDMTEYDPSDQNSNIMRDKQLFGNSAQNSELRRSKGGLPDLKSTKSFKRDKHETSDTYLFNDKQLAHTKQRVSRDDDNLTQSNPNSGIQPKDMLFNDKELYRQQSLRKSDSGEIPDLKSSEIVKNKKGEKTDKVGASSQKLKQIAESDEDSFMGKSHMSGQELIPVHDGKLKQVKKGKYQRESIGNDGMIVAEGVPIERQDKFRRNTGKLAKIDSMSRDEQQAQQTEKANLKDRSQQQNVKDSKNNKEIEQANLKQKANIKKAKSNNSDLMDIPILEKQSNKKPADSMDLLEGSFVEHQTLKEKAYHQDQNIESAGLRDRENKKKQPKRGMQGFDDFLEDKDPQNLLTKQKQKLNKASRFKQSEEKQLATAKLKQKLKKPSVEYEEENMQVKEGQTVQDGNIIQRKNKFRRNVPTSKSDDLEEGQIKETNKKKIQKEGQKYQDQTKQNPNQKQKKSRKKRAQGQGQSQLGDQYEHRQQENKQKNRGRGNLGINQNNGEGEYEQVRRKNKDNMFSPSKGISGMIESLDVGEFEGSGYDERPESKVLRPGSKGKGNLQIDDRSAHDSDNDSVSVRKQRASAILKARKKGNLGTDDKSQYSDDSVSSRPEKKKEQRERKKRNKSGILQINKKVNDEGLDSIQL